MLNTEPVVRLVLTGVTLVWASCSDNRYAEQEAASLLNQCFELVQPALLYQTKCDRRFGPEAPLCDTAMLFSQIKAPWPTTPEAYMADPQKARTQIMSFNTWRGNGAVLNIYGPLPVGQHLHVSNVVRWRGSPIETGSFWVATATLDGGPLAGHMFRMPSGSDGAWHAWIAIQGPPLLVSSILKQCR